MIISIASGKGGTGKTTVALNLALSLPDVQLIDCDVEEPNLHLFLSPQVHRTLSVTLPVPGVDETKCTYCGKCAEVCKFNALAVVKNQILIFPELCHGCGGCSLLCPERAIRENPREIGVIHEGSQNGLSFVQGILNVGEPMPTPIIREEKETDRSEENGDPGLFSRNLLPGDRGGAGKRFLPPGHGEHPFRP